jgi:hypothetical protein
MRTRRATDRNQSRVANVLSDDHTKQFAAIRVSESRRHFAIRHSPNSRRTRPIADPQASAWKLGPGEVRESAQHPEIACELRVTDLARDSAGRARAQSTTTPPGRRAGKQVAASATSATSGATEARVSGSRPVMLAPVEN